MNRREFMKSMGMTVAGLLVAPHLNFAEQIGAQYPPALDDLFDELLASHFNDPTWTVICHPRTYVEMLYAMSDLSNEEIDERLAEMHSEWEDQFYEPA